MSVHIVFSFLLYLFPELDSKREFVHDFVCSMPLCSLFHAIVYFVSSFVQCKSTYRYSQRRLPTASRNSSEFNLVMGAAFAT